MRLAPSRDGAGPRGTELNRRQYRGRQRLRAAVLVAVASMAIASCGGGGSGGGSGSGAAPSVKANQYGTELSGALPAVGMPSRGGTITVAQFAGQTPTDIFPMIDDTTCGTATVNFVSNQYIPLYAGPDGAEPKIDERLSAAELPQYSNDDKTVTITLKPGLKWSDGKPVNAQDVIFYLTLLRAAVTESTANWCQYSPGRIPDNITSWTTKGQDTVVLQLSHSVNPNWFTANQLQDTDGGIYPLPSQDWDVDSSSGEKLTDWATNPADALKIYDYLHSQGATVATFASNPLWKVVDGPFRLEHFSTTNSSYELVRNPAYSLKPKAYTSVIDVQTYASSPSETTALEAGSLDIGTLDPSAQLRSVARLRRRGYSVFGGPEWGWFGGIINFKDATDDFDKVVAQPYIRGVFAELVDQPALLKSVYHGWAVAAYGPVPTAPYSPYVSSAVAKAAWPYDPGRAVASLKAHGWRVRPGGETTCAEPGTKPDECGAGIPTGTPIKFVWAHLPESVASTGVLESEAFASEARRAAGIDVTLVAKPFNFLIANYNNQNPAAAKYVDDWGVNNYGGVEVDYYPTQDGVLDPGSSLNLGSYDDPTADKLMAASVTSPSTKAIASEVSYLSESYPVFYMPDQDWITVVNDRIGGAHNAFLTMTQQDYEFQFLYVNRRK
jgi:peptide/nickel transport system substrate-binding protein